LNWSEYTKKAVTTAVHNTKEKALTCFCFGLVGEYAEIEEKLLESNADPVLVKKELGDFCWYLANYADKAGIEVNKTYVNLHTDQPWTLLAEFLEINKKLYRDKDWEFDAEAIEKVQPYVDTFYGLVEALCNKYNFNLSDVLALNIEKLFDRKARGVIQGSGDER